MGKATGATMTTDRISELNSLGQFLTENILGQTEPLTEITELVQRSFLNLRFPNRPVCSMLLAGPTGVGKTETVNLLCQHFTPYRDQLVRLDMSEFQNQNALGLLIGNQVGERGLLGHYYSKNGGNGVLLFDEIEKAHPLIMDVFLQILSAARFTLANGETLDLSNYVVVATTNIGSRMLMESKSTDRETIVKRALRAITSEMRPEIFGRFNLVTVFNSLDLETLRRIGEYQVSKVTGLINALGHKITVDKSAVAAVQRAGYSEKFGARPMQEMAMAIIGSVVAGAVLKSGGQHVRGRIVYDERNAICSLKDGH